MDLRDLNYLSKIIETGSVVDAASQLGRTPPALTKAIRRLEDEVGSALFVKSGRGVQPTQAALHLVGQTRGIARHLEVLRTEVAHISSGQSGLVRIGVSATMAAIYLPQLLRRLARDLPQMRVSLVNGMNNVLRQQLRDGDLDVILGVYDDQDDEFEGFAIAHDEVRVVAAVGHKLEGRSLALSDLLNERWVLPTRAVAMRQWFDAAFTVGGLKPPEAHVETNSIAILENLIADSDMLSFVSNWKVGTRLVRNSLTALDVPGLVMNRKFGLAWSKLIPPAPAPALLINYVRQRISADSLAGG